LKTELKQMKVDNKILKRRNSALLVRQTELEYKCSEQFKLLEKIYNIAELQGAAPSYFKGNKDHSQTPDHVSIISLVIQMSMSPKPFPWKRTFADEFNSISQHIPSKIRGKFLIIQ